MNRPAPLPSGLVERLLADAPSVVSVELDAGGRVTSCNRAFARVLDGCPEPRGLLLVEALMPESREAFARAASAAASARLSFQWRGGPVHTMDCWLAPAGDGLVLVGVLFMLSHAKVVEEMALLTNDLANLGRELARKNAELERARHEVRTLTGLIPICAYCKKIRDDAGAWQQLEAYVHQRSSAEFSHGVCPDCFERALREADGEPSPDGGAGASGGQAV